MKVLSSSSVRAVGATRAAPRAVVPVSASAAGLSCRAFISSTVALKTVSLRASSAKARASVVEVKASEEISYVMIKPDGVQRALVGEIITRFEKKGFTLKGLKLVQVSRAVAEEHYKDLKAKPFFKDLVDYICSGPVVSMIWAGKGVVKSARTILGATNPLEAAPGTIRGDFAVEVGRNVCHASDSVENGQREVQLWFGENAVVEWRPHLLPWLREENRA